MGKNYRKEWETPVTLPVLNLAKLGLTVKEIGGGRQTKSLRLLDHDSVEWALRTVDKDVRPALPKIIRNGFTVSIVQDMVSAAHPYAPLTIPLLANAVGVQAAQPMFYFVPDDPAIGEYRSIFANTVCLLEKRDLLPGVKTKGTEKMLANLLEDSDNKLDQAAYLNARLLDMLIADWDRHYDQWKWAELGTNKKTTFLALPKDRDQAYFYSKGALLKFIRLFGMKFTVGLTGETANIVKLNRIAWSLDGLLLNELGKAEWQQIAQSFQHNLSDSIIREAVQRLPPQLYSINGEVITRKLLNRKSKIATDVLKYYLFHAANVTVYGTDQAEHFYITGGKDSIIVTVRSANDEARVIYRRTFYPMETKAIQLLGLGGDDIFTSDESLQTAIQFSIDGGTGANQYHLSDQLKANAISNSNLDAHAYLKKLRKPLRIRKEE